jgi:hypothetical protein
MTPHTHNGLTPIEVRAATLLARHAGSGVGGDPLVRICRGEGIDLLDADLRDIAGVLRHEDGRWRIYLNRSDSPHRHRFTLAHLLGHYALHAVPGRTFVAGILTGCFRQGAG